MASPIRLKVFLASPGDVGEERAIAREILSQLPYDALVGWQVVFEVVAWDQPRSGPPLLATVTPQTAIAAGLPKPSECDVVVVILWSRMGTPLPDSYRKPDGTRYRSGTEWEYLEARAAVKDDTPIVLVYRRTAPCPLDSDDPLYQERLSQRQQLDAFFAEFRNADGSIRWGINDYADPADFRVRFEQHFRSVIARQLTRASASQGPPVSGHAVAHGRTEPQSSTTTAAFVGPATRGPVAPQLIVGWDEFVRTYGEGLPSRISFLSHAVRGFFRNAGGRAYVARVLGAGAAVARVDVESTGAQGPFRFEASSPGDWGNRLAIRIQRGTRVGLRLTVVERAADDSATQERERALEDWDNASLDPSRPNFLPSMINAGPRSSHYVACTAVPGRFDPPAVAVTAWLAGGADGAPPGAADYCGSLSPAGATGLLSMADLEDVALLCIPDHVHERLPARERQTIAEECVASSECLEYRFTLLSVERGRSNPASIVPLCDSRHAALYAPWICVDEIGAPGTTWVPPAGHVAGVLARCDLAHGIHHPPIDEVLQGLSRDADGRALEFDFGASDRDTLLRLGVNAVGTSDDGQVRTLSALTTATDEEVQSIAGQRLLSWIVTSIDRGTRWARFEANDEVLWRRLAADVSAFLETVWSSGALQGLTPQEAFYVRCDADTTTQNDVDNGRVICEVGLALAASGGRAATRRIVIQAGDTHKPAQGAS